MAIVSRVNYTWANILKLYFWSIFQILSQILDLRQGFQSLFNKGGGNGREIPSYNGIALYFCQTPDLGLGLGVDFTFPNNNNKKKNNPHLIFQRKEGTRGLKFGTQTYRI